MEISLKADKITFRGPRIDGSYIITFEVGEYEISKVGELIIKLKNDKIVNLTIEQNDEQG